jgi:hypothetical protein
MMSGLQELGTVVHLRRATDQGTWDRLRSYGVGYVRQKLCALHGHDQLLQFESDRMFLRCTSCGFETPGWQVGERPPRPAFRSKPRQRRVSRPQAIRDRRIA